LAAPEAYVSLENKYFAKRKLALNNPAYTTLFRKIYDNALASAFHRREKSKFNKAFESDNAYGDLNNLMRSYSIYEDKNFRDLLLAKSIFDATENALLTRSKAIGILQKIMQNSQDGRITKLTDNYLVRLSHLMKNSVAPYFEVEDIALSDYRGKYLYVHFCNTTNSIWERDFELIKKLREAFGKEIEFLSVASDADQLRFQNRLKQKDATWPIVHIDHENLILKDYNIKVFPTYILIDPKGKVYQYPARGPLDGIEKSFVKIQRDVQRRNYSQKK